MLKKAKQFIQLNFKEKILCLEAYITLAAMRYAMVLFPFDRLTRPLTQKKSKDWITLQPYSVMQNALLISRALCRAANNTPWESACLVQSLCAYRMLRRRGIAGVFYLGVTKDAKAREKMKAHAWTEVGEKILTGGAGHKEYTVISVYYWGKQ